MINNKLFVLTFLMLNTHSHNNTNMLNTLDRGDIVTHERDIPEALRNRQISLCNFDQRPIVFEQADGHCIDIEKAEPRVAGQRWADYAFQDFEAEQFKAQVVAGQIRYPKVNVNATTFYTLVLKKAGTISAYDHHGHLVKEFLARRELSIHIEEEGNLS
jgi:hypothetical protein